MIHLAYTGKQESERTFEFKEKKQKGQTLR